MSFKVTWKIHLLCFIISLILCIIARDYINNMFINLLKENEVLELTGNLLINLYIFIILIFIPITIVHELIHGITYRLFGGKVKYGFKGIYAYAQEVSGIALHRTKFLIVLLAPVTIISVFSVFIPGNIGGIVFILNLLGSRRCINGILSL